MRAVTRLGCRGRRGGRRRPRCNWRERRLGMGGRRIARRAGARCLGHTSPRGRGRARRRTGHRARRRGRRRRHQSRAGGAAAGSRGRRRQGGENSRQRRKVGGAERTVGIDVGGRAAAAGEQRRGHRVDIGAVHHSIAIAIAGQRLRIRRAREEQKRCREDRRRCEPPQPTNAGTVPAPGAVLPTHCRFRRTPSVALRV